MLTPEEIEEMWKVADDARGEESWQSKNVFDLINHIQNIEQQNKTLLEALDRIHTDSTDSWAVGYSLRVIQSTQK